MNNDPWTLIQKILLMVATALGFVCAMGQSLSMIDRYQHEQGQLDKEGKQTQVAPQPDRRTLRINIA